MEFETETRPSPSTSPESSCLDENGNNIQKAGLMDSGKTSGMMQDDIIKKTGNTEEGEPIVKRMTKGRKTKEYNLRDSSLINRIQTERRRSLPKQPKPKAKPPPLSKYRRKTANTRERSRMQEINDAFETLRQVVPQYPPLVSQAAKSTKINTLRLAMNYIAALRDMLGYEDFGFPSNPSPSSSSSTDMVCSSPDSSVSTETGLCHINSYDRSLSGTGSLDSEGESITL